MITLNKVASKELKAARSAFLKGQRFRTDIEDKAKLILDHMAGKEDKGHTGGIRGKLDSVVPQDQKDLVEMRLWGMFYKIQDRNRFEEHHEVMNLGMVSSNLDWYGHCEAAEALAESVESMWDYDQCEMSEADEYTGHIARADKGGFRDTCWNKDAEPGEVVTLSPTEAMEIDYHRKLEEMRANDPDMF